MGHGYLPTRLAFEIRRESRGLLHLALGSGDHRELAKTGTHCQDFGFVLGWNLEHSMMGKKKSGRHEYSDVFYGFQIH